LDKEDQRHPSARKTYFFGRLFIWNSSLRQSTHTTRDEILPCDPNDNLPLVPRTNPMSPRRFINVPNPERRETPLHRRIRPFRRAPRPVLPARYLRRPLHQLHPSFNSPPPTLPRAPGKRSAAHGQYIYQGRKIQLCGTFGSWWLGRVDVHFFGGERGGD
jgi:hypothetical protein